MAEDESSPQEEPSLHDMCATPSSGEDEVLKAIEKDPSQVSQQDSKGRIPLHYVARFNGQWTQVIRKMLSVDAGIASQSFPESKLLPLHILCRHHASQLDSISALLHAYPKSSETVDDYECLPLHFACSGDAELSVVRLLLGAHPGASQHADASGWLPHHYTARCGTKLDVLRALLKANPDGAMSVSKDGQVPLDCLGLNPNASEDFLRALLEM